ncbi:hypothetical protein [Achromobacter sp. DH1f]|uniref:hypothetical protein n=1 Tax=Achromobacter sp. DH1f TaxID=1397275 RepID=UPI00046975E6|nr:hypothetical protein [Achromobacter sp. DH1f]
MAKQRPNTDTVRFQLSQFPDLMPLADRVLEDGEGRGGLVREIRRLVRLGMAMEAAGIAVRDVEQLADGRLQLVEVAGRAEPPYLPPRQRAPTETWNGHDARAPVSSPPFAVKAPAPLAPPEAPVMPPAQLAHPPGRRAAESSKPSVDPVLDLFVQ